MKDTYDLCIIDYGMGNLMSVLRAFELIGCKVAVTNNIDIIENAKRIVLPGVGAFSAAMDNLKSLDLVDCLTRKVVIEKTPFLGICLGMQLIANDSCENGNFIGLGWIPASVQRLESSGGLRVPHMGWSDVSVVERKSTLFEGVGEDKSYYFVHSYHVNCYDPVYIGSTCSYGNAFISSIQYENIYATQFHPEKSQKNGLQLLRNFVRLTG